MFLVLKPRVISGCSVAPLLKCRLLRASLINTAVTNSHQCQSSITHPSELASDSSEQMPFNSTFCNRWSVGNDKYSDDESTNKNDVHEQHTMEKEGAVFSSADKSESEEQHEDKGEKRSKLSSSSSSCVQSTSMLLSPEFSYRYLLERGAFASVMQLAHSPFAPSPLRVYRDLLEILQETTVEEHTEALSLASYTSELEDKKFLPKVQDNHYITSSERTKEKLDKNTEICQQLEGNVKAEEIGNIIKGNNNTVHVINARELQVMSFASRQITRKRVISALSAPGEVSQLMRVAYNEVETSMNELKEMSDVESIERAREKVSELCSFMEYLQGIMSRKVSENENQSTCMVSYPNSVNNKTIINAKEKTVEQLLPNSVYAETLHYLLEMCSITGLHLSAVQALDELIQLSERVQISQEIANHTSNANATSENTVDNRKMNNQTISVFSIDQIVERVQYNISKQVRTVNAHDHIAAMESCALHKDFMTALSLYRRFMVHATEGRFTLQSTDLERAMVALCHCVKCNGEFDTLRELMLHEEAASTLPVSVVLYTALLEALCNLPRHANQRTIALALYRRLRDGLLRLNVHSYAALIGCSVGAYETSNEHCLIRAQELACATLTDGNDNLILSRLHKRGSNTSVLEKTSTSLTPVHGQDKDTTIISVEYRDPLQSFAFYHEARSCCNISDFTAEMYTNLLKAYVHGGYGNDAKQTLSVLIESGAPLSLSSFHTLLSSSSITLRDGQEMVECMTKQYKLYPTPITYGWLVLATIRQQMRSEASPKLNNVNYILQLFDFHEKAVQCFANLHPAALHNDTQTLLLSSKGAGAEQLLDNRHELNDKSTEKQYINALNGNNTNDDSIQRVYACMSAPASQDAVLISTYPFYVLSVQNALMHVKSEIYSLENKQRIAPYLLPLIRIAQMQMNAFTSMPPQMPTQLSLHYKQQSSTNGSSVSTNNNKNTNHVSNISSSGNNSSRESNLCVAVLAADALLSLEECVLPFIHFYSAIFIPFSTLLTYQYAIMVNDVMMESNNPSYHMSRWLNVETHASSVNASHYIDESLYDMSKLHALRHFLHQYKDVIHIGSIDEELELNRVTNRYGVSIRDEVESSFGKVAVAAIHLARKDVLLTSESHPEEESNEEQEDELKETNSESYQKCNNNSSNSNKLSSLCTLYAEHNANIIAVSNRFHECGRYIVKLKKEYVKRKPHMNKKRGYTSYDDDDDNKMFCGLRDALEHVYYHNPSVYPNWTPPSLNVRKITSQQTETEHEEQKQHHHQYEEQSKQLEQEAHQWCESSDEKKSKTCTNDKGNVNVENVIDTIGSKEAEKMYKAFITNRNIPNNNSAGRESSQIKSSKWCSCEVEHAGNGVNEYCDQDVLDPEMVSRMMCDE